MSKVVVGLTGPTGCGKTTASKFLKSCGFEVVNADEIVKELYLNCKSLIKEVGQNFEGVVAHGVVNKKKLSKIVFSNEFERLKLEQIVWPFIIKVLKSRIQNSYSLNVVLDAPTLFESGAFKMCDFSIAVLSSKNHRLRRIVERDGLSEELAIDRINSQKPDSFYINNADGVIINDDGFKDSLFKKVFALISSLKKSKKLIK